MFAKLNSTAEKQVKGLRDLIQEQRKLVDVGFRKLITPGVVILFPQRCHRRLEADLYCKTEKEEHVGYAVASSVWSEEWYILPHTGSSSWYICANIGMSRFIEVFPERLLEAHSKSGDTVMCCINGRRVGSWQEVVDDDSGGTRLHVSSGESLSDYIGLSNPWFSNKLSFQKKPSIFFPLSSRQTFLDFIQIIARILTLCLLVKKPPLRGPIVMLKESCNNLDIAAEDLAEDEVMTLVGLGLALRLHYYTGDFSISDPG